jgi:hypothetical protein
MGVDIGDDHMRVASSNAFPSNMPLELATPDSFPAFPYNPPYSIQVDLMRHLYAAIEHRKVTIIESPTGTVNIAIFGLFNAHIGSYIGQNT